MKKELKKYTLVEYLGEEHREYDSIEECKNLIEILKKHNKKQKKKYLFGNVIITKVQNKYHVIVHKYNKLTPKLTISQLDELTSKMNEKELIYYFKSSLKTKISFGYDPDINIIYLNGREKNYPNYSSVRLSYLPVLYKDDIKYLSKKYVMKCVEYHLNNNDYYFFLELANKFEIYRVIEDDIDRLRTEVNKLRYSNYDNSYLLTIVSNLYDNLVFERDKDSRILRDCNGNILKSHRRIRDFAIFVRDYGMIEKKKNSPFKYNKKMKENVFDEDDTIQDEYSLYYWDQINGDFYEDFTIYFDEKEKIFKRK